MKKYPEANFFKPKNKHKYKGDINNIISRSSYETKFMMWCDHNTSVIEWSSEENIIPYKSPIDGRYHRYFVDFKVKVKTLDNKTETYLIEVKPYNQTIEPNVQKNVTKRYLNEVVTWSINKSKWKAAEDYCKDRGWKFKILTEKELNIKR